MNLQIFSVYSGKYTSLKLKKVEHYKDVNRDSGVLAYEIGDKSIKVKFKDGSVYLYTYASASKFHIEKMKQLAKVGDGLNSYINKNVKDNYVR